VRELGHNENGRAKRNIRKLVHRRYYTLRTTSPRLQQGSRLRENVPRSSTPAQAGPANDGISSGVARTPQQGDDGPICPRKEDAEQRTWHFSAYLHWPASSNARHSSVLYLFIFLCLNLPPKDPPVEFVLSVSSVVVAIAAELAFGTQSRECLTDSPGHFILQ